MQLFKLGRLGPDEPVEHHHPAVYTWERTTGPARLVISAAERHAELLAALAACWRGPAWLLYVLSVPRTGARPARYQSPAPLPAAEVRAFLVRHREYLERDARHALWIKQAEGEGQLVYERHNQIYAYGPLEAYEDVLETWGIVRGAYALPVPHSHHYHATFDTAERAVLSEFQWRPSPLQASDED